MAERKQRFEDVVKREFGSETATAVEPEPARGSDDMSRVFKFFLPTSERRRLDHEATQPAPAPTKQAGIAGLSDAQLEKLSRLARDEIEKRDEDVSEITDGYEPVEQEDDFYLPTYEEDDEEDEDGYYDEEEGGFYS